MSIASSLKSFSFRSLFAVLPVFLLLFPLSASAAEAGSEPAGMNERMMTLVIQLGIILFAARAGGRLFEKLGMPAVLGELCTGILIGPSCLGTIPVPGFDHGIFYVAESVKCGPLPVSPELYGICTLASVTLLFLVGVETNLKLLFRYALAGGLVGLGGVVFSFAFGDILGIFMLPRLMEGSFGFFHPACIFLGVMSTATSVSITARILSEKKKLDSPEGVTILAGAVIDDVLGIIMLAIGTGIVAAQNKGGTVDWSGIGWVSAKAIGVWLAATAIGLICSHYISRFLKNCFSDKAQIATMALGFAMIIAGLFEEAQLAMIIGAYVLGLSLSRTDISQVIREHLQPIYMFLVPVFFVVMGMLVDLSAFKSPQVLIFGAVYTVGAILAKMVGCGLPTLLCKFNLRGAVRVGIGMVPRGEVALIVAGLGLSQGLISKDIFGVAVLMTLITTVLPPPLIVRAFKSPKSGLRKSALKTDDETPDIVFTFDNAESTRLVTNALLETFDQEGFFVHSLNIKDGVYQVLKENKVINIHASEDARSVRFRCSSSEVHFVRTVMREVIANLEQTIKALRRPLDTELLLLNPQQGDAAARRHARNSRMRKYLNADCMIPDFKAKDKEDAIRQLVKRLVWLGKISDEDSAFNAVMAREQSMSTGLRHGFACPHARTPLVNDIVCIIAIAPDGIEFNSADGKPAKIIQLILSPTNTPAPYMEFMAAMSSIYDAEEREALLKCRSARDLLSEFHSKLV